MDPVRLIVSPIYTIGHSNRPLTEFLNILDAYQIKQLVDIRSIPKSRHNPHFAGDNLESSLSQAGIRYIYLKALGGRRPAVQTSVNLGWRNQSFRNYADYMQSAEFVQGIEELIGLSKHTPTAIMCAEAVPWRCHRSLVGDALLVRQVRVVDIISITSSREHALTSFAAVDGLALTYPSDNSQSTEKGEATR